MNIVHPSSGSIRYFGLELSGSERAIKQRVGFAGGAVNYYPRKRIADILAVTRMFYDNWDEAAHRHYMDVFSIDPDKTPAQLSEGMRVKLNLAIAMSHRAELLILDEPTSGLDPVSREELLEIFRYLRGRGAAILFSTHITSDLEKCADDITYIRAGQFVASQNFADFIAAHRAEGRGQTLEEIMIGYEREAWHEKLAD